MMSRRGYPCLRVDSITGRAIDSLDAGDAAWSKSEGLR